MDQQDDPQRKRRHEFRGVWRVPREPDVNGRVRSAFAAVVHDRWFWIVARLIPASAYFDDLEQLRHRFPTLAEFLDQFERADFRYAFWDQGGWADFDDRQPGLVVLSLSRSALLRIWRAATASHELLHLARHVQRITPFGVRPPLFRRWWEELKVFAFGVAYAPLSWTALLIVPLAPLLLVFGILGLLALL